MPIVESDIEKKVAQGAAMEITVSRQDLVRELTATQSVVEPFRFCRTFSLKRKMTA